MQPIIQATSVANGGSRVVSSPERGDCSTAVLASDHHHGSGARARSSRCFRLLWLRVSVLALVSQLDCLVDSVIVGQTARTGCRTSGTVTVAISWAGSQSHISTCCLHGAVIWHVGWFACSSAASSVPSGTILSLFNFGC